MLRLRPYKPCDAKYVLNWIKDEVSFHKWCSTLFSSYPIDEDMLNSYYDEWDNNPRNFAMTAFDESGVTGHMTIKFIDESLKTVRFGFIIVDDKKRGQGLGKEIISLAIKYADDILRAERITLGVFENNPGAYSCYKSLGFTEVPLDEPSYREILGEKWRIIEMEKRLEVH